MNRALYQHLASNKENLHDELDRAISQKEKSSLDEPNELGVKITSTYPMFYKSSA